MERNHLKSKSIISFDKYISADLTQKPIPDFKKARLARYEIFPIGEKMEKYEKYPSGDHLPTIIRGKCTCPPPCTCKKRKSRWFNRHKAEEDETKDRKSSKSPFRSFLPLYHPRQKTCSKPKDEILSRPSVVVTEELPHIEQLADPKDVQQEVFKKKSKQPDDVVPVRRSLLRKLFAKIHDLEARNKREESSKTASEIMFGDIIQNLDDDIEAQDNVDEVMSDLVHRVDSQIDESEDTKKLFAANILTKCLAKIEDLQVRYYKSF